MSPTRSIPLDPARPPAPARLDRVLVEYAAEGAVTRAVCARCRG